jgi:hypothetical protein
MLLCNVKQQNVDWIFKTRNVCSRKVGLWILLSTPGFNTEQINFTAVFQKYLIAAILISLVEIVGSQSQEKFELRHAYKNRPTFILHSNRWIKITHTHTHARARAQVSTYACMHTLCSTRWVYPFLSPKGTTTFRKQFCFSSRI